ncbi:hypothetical protein NHH03_07745 [Stieleria sp. TO1_6]|uniref:hypothetical protein n=1 Tax=Stieleria tagensis TaxID=2956795 RepID=UPI00209B4205|nr:hypothetical protein [Stieleria tagensis]MCO8121625.1 hypothetical protein [Stieleria tagensis]
MPNTKQINFPLLISTLLLMSGCASLGDYHYEHTQQLRARTQYHQAGNPGCSKYPKDYKKGWLHGFYEVSTGGNSCPPAVAPECYWKPGQILNDCDNRRHAYYSGWQDGAARASQFPDTHYLRIYETCECPFPRCDCKQCGTSPCGCQAGCGDHILADGGLIYDSGTIEADREIMMVPIPAETPVETSPGIPTHDEPAVDTVIEPKGETTALTEDSTAAVTATPDWLGPLVKPEATVVHDAGTDVPLPKRIALLPPMQSRTVNHAKTVDLLPAETSIRYQYPDDNSVTIEFSPSDQTGTLGIPQVSESEAVLSDFDIQIDGVGFVE